MFFLTDNAVIVTKIGRIELTYGKCHIIEYSAGIIFISYDTFLVRYRILCGVYKVLCRTNDANDGKDADRNYKLPFSALAITKVPVDSYRDTLGNIIATATAAARIAFVLLNYLRGKYDRVDDFNHCLRHILLTAARLGNTAEAIARGTSENTYVTFSAVEYDLFLHYRNAFKFLRASGCKASLEEKLDIESYRYRIKSSVEAYGVYADIRPGYSRFLCSHSSCPFDYIITAIGKIYTNVFVAITVPA